MLKRCKTCEKDIPDAKGNTRYCPPCVRAVQVRRYTDASKKRSALRAREHMCADCGQQVARNRTCSPDCCKVCKAKRRATQTWVRSGHAPRREKKDPCVDCGKTITPQSKTNPKKRCAGCLRSQMRKASTLRQQSKRALGLCIGSDKIRESEWDYIRSLYLNRCAYCFGEGNPLWVDHVVPLARGGTHTLDNIAPACKRCNLSKGKKLLCEWVRRAA